jgi:cyclopropane-fatty-acyl-phospholipid synthase
MTIWQAAFQLAERAPVPDVLVRHAIETLVGRTSRRLASVDSDSTARFIGELERLPIAVHVESANEQHYEVPAAFYEAVLGPQRKYSCCYYDGPLVTLADAEERALALTAEHARLADGQSILELGCGWGSLSIWMARAYPRARILAVSNSRSQRTFIARKAADLGLSNLEIVTADMNDFSTDHRFDRIVSIEMFEHMANWRRLLTRCRRWLEPDGRMFVHVFTHRTTPYRFDHTDKQDWIAQHFFTGGCMPNRSLMRAFSDVFEVESEWFWEGTHYSRTARDWLANIDANGAAVTRALADAYGAEATTWYRRWRLFFLATSGLFGFGNGREWGVSHYLLKPPSTGSN